MISYMELIKMELNGLYGEEVLRDHNELIKLYDIYDGKGQDWDTPANLDYKPTKKKTNYVKKIIKEEARFLFGKTPEFTFVSQNKDQANEIQKYMNKVLNDNGFAKKIIQAARDCFIGKRVAIKLGFPNDGGIKISFRNALEFVYEPFDDDVDNLKSVVFFYAINDKMDKRDQRIWKQKFHMQNGSCILDEGIYNGYGEPIEVTHSDFVTGLDFIPVKVIINDGLSGDLKGESDVDELKENQEQYNRLNSDDIDALKFNMFPMTVASNAHEDVFKSIKIAPAAIVDLKTDVISDSDGRKADMYKLESSFSYNDRIENAVNRMKNDMFDVLNIPNISIEELRGTMTSAKGMKAIYWQLITRCEEKFQTWRPALEWMVYSILEMSKAYHLDNLIIPNDLTVNVENIYPLMEDEFEEKALDLQTVNTQSMSRKTFIKKWNKGVDDDGADLELKQITIEKAMLEETYTGGMNVD